MAMKQLFRLNDTFYHDNEFINFGTDFEFTEDPLNECQQSLAKTIEEIIFNDPNNCPRVNPVHPTDWDPPDPLYL